MNKHVFAENPVQVVPQITTQRRSNIYWLKTLKYGIQFYGFVSIIW